MRVLNLGAGVQSTTVYLMATPERSRPTTTPSSPTPAKSLRLSTATWTGCAASAGSRYSSAAPGNWAKISSAGRNSTGGRFAAIPAYVDHGPGRREGRGRRQCTREYKIDVIERTIRRELLGLKPRQRIPKGVTVTQAYGISIDEAGRSIRIRERIRRHSPWIAPEFPLLDRLMSRADCIRWLQNRVPHEVPKSSCVFCPYKSNEQWRWLKDNDPEGWARAVEIDEALRNGAVASRGMAGQQYIHRSCVPLREADLGSGSIPGQLSFALECAGMCGV
jgi:hypothetical protein